MQVNTLALRTIPPNLQEKQRPAVDGDEVNEGDHAELNGDSAVNL